MATISNPFVMEVPRKLTDEELVNAIRQDIIGELEAIHEYDAHVQATDNEDAKKVLSDIRDEEREHMGELLELLERLAPDEKALHDEGRITTKNLVTICAWQYTGAGCVSNYYSTVSGLFTLFTVKVWIPMALILVLKFVGGALIRTILSTVYRKDFEND